MQLTLIALVENKPGVLNRVASLFRRRNFNIESINAGRTEKPDISRMTIVLENGTVDARNDSQVLFYDQVIPGSTLVAYLNADHWALAVPIARTHDIVGEILVDQNAFPREALHEALLRFIEEDLQDRGN